MASKNLKMQLLVPDDGSESTITVYHQGQAYNADSSHPLWDAILTRSIADDPTVVECFDIMMAIGKRTVLSERVSYAGGKLFLDDDEVTGPLVDFIVRLYGENGDIEPFVKLLEGIVQNPSKNSRNMLYDYIKREKVTILPDGHLVLYKSVYRRTASDAQYESTSAGPAFINGAPHKDGRVPQSLGDVITMPRTDVTDDPNTACHTGLHVGAWGYVGTFQGNVKLEVHVHPRDVVNVPYHDRKLRVCKYRIIREVTGPYDQAVLRDAKAVVPEKPKPVKVRGDVTPEKEVKHPSRPAFNAMRERAKGARKGLKAYATTGGRTWKLIEGDGSEREHWSTI